MYRFYYYPKCSTCLKAKKLLKDKSIVFEEVDFTDTNIELNTLKTIINKFNFDINKLFNINGKLYRELNMKEKIKTLTLEEKLSYLNKNSMLVKRPILIDEKTLIVGFKEDEYKKI